MNEYSHSVKKVSSVLISVLFGFTQFLNYSTFHGPKIAIAMMKMLFFIAFKL
jgi:hypothetical protein